MQNHGLGIHSDNIWADSTTEGILKYLKTYSVDLSNQPNYLGCLKNSFHWVILDRNDWLSNVFTILYVIQIMNLQFHATKKLSCQKNYLSILDQLDMSNPMIVGEFGYLRNRKMFHLIKKLSRILKIPKVCSYLWSM